MTTIALSDMGMSAGPLRSRGERVRIHQGAYLVGAEHIDIASDVIIDTGAILIASAECPIRIGNYVHIGAHSSVCGVPITFDDFSGISHGVRIVGGSEDYSGSLPTNPTIPRELRRVNRLGVRLGRHVVVGANSVVLPVDIPEGVAVGALSFVGTREPSNIAMEPWTIWAGTPARKIGTRNVINITVEQLRGVNQ
jgi:acetyltransferase-like isoleucine patch superfamily enzyme